MQAFPDIPRVADADLDGHLWIQEWVAGGRLRFQLQPSGLLRFGDAERVFDGDVPLGYRYAVRHVREAFDRDALRDALDDPASVTFHGVAVRRDPVEYDWERTPGFLGFDAWDDDAGRFLPPDAVEKLYGRLRLDPLNAVEKEVRAADFDPESYGTPASAWRDGPAAGVLVRSKTGGRGKRLTDAARKSPDPVSGTPEELAERFVTRERVEQARRRAVDADAGVDADASADAIETRSVDAEGVAVRVVEAVAREEYARFLGEGGVDSGEFESAATARVHRLLGESG